MTDWTLRAGLISIAMPIRDERREVAAVINLVANASMISLEGIGDQLLPHLFATFENISAWLRARGRDCAMSGQKIVQRPVPMAAD